MGLALTRKQGESIILQTSDGDIEVVFWKQHGKQIRLCITAPDSVVIARKELLEKGHILIRK